MKEINVIFRFNIVIISQGLQIFRVVVNSFKSSLKHPFIKGGLLFDNC